MADVVVQIHDLSGLQELLLGEAERRRVPLAAVGALARQRVANGAVERDAVEPRFEQKVAGTGLDRACGQLHIVQAGQDHHRDIRGSRADPEKRLQFLAVRQD